jgi:hypothetical protein
MAREVAHRAGGARGQAEAPPDLPDASVPIPKSAACAAPSFPAHEALVFSGLLIRSVCCEAQRTSGAGHYCSSGITQSGASPRATRWQLSKALRKRAGWLSQVGPA